MEKPPDQPCYFNTHLDLGPECVGVALQNGLHSCLSHLLIVLVVETADAVAVVTIAPTGKALTVPGMQEACVATAEEAPA